MIHQTTSCLYIVLLCTFSFSCVQKNSAQKELEQESLTSTETTESLKFISGIRAIYQDSRGDYWIGSHSEGLSRYDGTSFEYFTTAEGLAADQVRSIQEDEFGNIYIGTADGVSRYSGGLLVKLEEKGDISMPFGNRSQEKGLWFNAGNRPGVLHFNGQELSYQAFPIYDSVSQKGLALVTDVAEGVGNKIWIATYSGIFSHGNYGVSHIDDSNLGIELEQGQLHVRSIFEDSQGRLWIGNNGLGVLLLHHDTLIDFSKEMGLVDVGSARTGARSPDGTLEHVFAIEEDAEGNVWFGDRDTGVWRFDGTAIINLTIHEDLTDPMVWTICRDKENKLLFGLASGGVYEFKGDSFEKVF